MKEWPNSLIITDAMITLRQCVEMPKSLVEGVHVCWQTKKFIDFFVDLLTSWLDLATDWLSVDWLTSQLTGI